VPHLLVVGAGPGIAAATARRLGRKGHAVGLVARREEELAELQSDLAGWGVLAGRAPADAADPAALTAAVELLVDTFGPADVLLHNVSVGREVPVADLTPEQLAADLAAGAVALQTAVRAVLPGMLELGAGTVLATGSGTADRPMASLPTLGAQKAALRALVVALASGLAPHGVHVATATIRGLVGEGRQIEPDRVAALYEELVAETAGPREAWRTVVDVRP
jgi:NADP-dependent 3-hydroxy acid dehydrogenase YdfG